MVTKILHLVKGDLEVNKEDFFISLFESPVIGDDGAFIDGKVYSKDLFVENVHFKREWMSLQQIAYKSMLVNLSDAIAMNAKPLHALIGIGFPTSYTLADLQALRDGFQQAADTYGFEIIGGDTIADDKLSISITLISKTNRPIYRHGVKEGDLLAYTGDLGSVKKDLERLLAGHPIPEKSKFIEPKLRDTFFYQASPHVSAALDISDGLFKEMERLSHASSIGFEPIEPINDAIGCSGEEYEMLFSFDPKNTSILKSIAEKTNTKITIIAQASKGRFNSPCQANHF
jgi:thiamine-monophosphate kinase